MTWRHYITAACFFGSFVLSSVALGFEGQDDSTPGSMAMAYKLRSNVWSRFDLGVVDAKITSRPPDTTKFDRRLESFGIFGFDAAVSPRFGLRVNTKAEVSTRRRSEKLPPRADVEQTFKRYDLEVDATFVTDKGLEFFGGVLGRHLPSSDISITTDSSSQTSHFDAVTLRSSRFGVVRRGGVWSGGFYYEIGGEAKRGFRLSASDNTQTSGEEFVFIPQRIGVFGEFVAAGFGWDFAFDFMQAAGEGPRDDMGNTLYSDYFGAKIGNFISIGGAGGVYTSVSHRTLSYSSNAFVELDTMPISTARFLLMLGKQDAHVYTGVILAYGEDGQSLPEFNTSYDYGAAAATFGMFYPF